MGVIASDWGFESIPCRAARALVTYMDVTGVQRFACRHHERYVRGRWPERYISEIDGDGLSEAKRAREIIIEENEGYVVTVDEDDEWTNREGMPEFNGAFR